MKWTKKWWVIAIILAIAFIVGWEEERCQAQAYKCRTSYAAQAQSERLSGNIFVDQRVAEQQAIAAACEPNGYFCHLFGAANLPTMLLVLIGIGGIWAALRTLNVIEAQTKLQATAMRQWVILSGWSHNIERHKEGNGTLTITIRVINPTKTPLNLLGYQFDIQRGSNGISIKHTLLPDEPFAIDFTSLLTAGQLLDRDTNGLILTLTGHISFVDVLKDLQRQELAGLLRFTPGGGVEFIPRGSTVRPSS